MLVGSCHLFLGKVGRCGPSPQFPQSAAKSRVPPNLPSPLSGSPSGPCPHSGGHTLPISLQEGQMGTPCPSSPWRRCFRVPVGPGDPPQTRPVTQHTSLTALLGTHYSWCLTGHVLRSSAVFRLALGLASAFVMHLGRLWWSKDQSFLCGLWVLSLSERSFLGTMVKRSLTSPTPASVRLDQNPDPVGAGTVCM